MTDIFSFDLQRDRLYEQVADRILELISSESLRPGDKLPSERELAEKLRVSRTVVREAIQALSVRGIIKVKPGCGTFIQELSLTDVTESIRLLLEMRHDEASLREIYEIRRMIEVEIAGLAAACATDEDVAALELELEGMINASGNSEKFALHDFGFHSALAIAADNELLTMFRSPIADLWMKLIWTSLSAPDATSDGIMYHKMILKHVKAGEPAAARAAMRSHIEHSRRQVETVRQQEDKLKHKNTNQQQ